MANNLLNEAGLVVAILLGAALALYALFVSAWGFVQFSRRFFWAIVVVLAAWKVADVRHHTKNAVSVWGGVKGWVLRNALDFVHQGMEAAVPQEATQDKTASRRIRKAPAPKKEEKTEEEEEEEESVLHEFWSGLKDWIPQ